MTSFKLFIAMCLPLLLLVSCAGQGAQSKKKQASFGNILGKWKDADSIVEYQENGNFKGQWGNTATWGSWQTNKDTLTMVFVNNDRFDYILIKQTPSELVLENIETKKRVVKKPFNPN